MTGEEGNDNEQRPLGSQHTMDVKCCINIIKNLTLQTSINGEQVFQEAPFMMEYAMYPVRMFQNVSVPEMIEEYEVNCTDSIHSKLFPLLAD